MTWLRHWLVCGGLLVTLAADPANFDQIKNYYQTREAVASRFFSKPNKIFHVYVMNRELLQDDNMSDNQDPQINLARGMYRQFVKRLESKGCSVHPVFMGNKGINWDVADVILVIKSTWVTTTLGYLQAQRDVVINDVELDYQIYIPEVYGKDPVADVVIRQTLPNSSYSQKSAENLFAEKLKQVYAWQDNDRLLEYLKGDLAEKPFILGRLTLYPDDAVAARLLALSDWSHEQAMLIWQNDIQGLVAAKNLYPFSTALSKLVYKYAIDIVDLRTRVDLLSYLYVAGYKDIQYLLNDILSQATDVETIEEVDAAIRISAFSGDKETLEHLSRIQGVLEEEQPSATLTRGQLKKAIAVLGNRF
jgi:hypothetical protein